uniref:Meiotic checkpoint regulator cut4, putative n=1 Tax=Arundo donax TaxID=35708 RepID=A0A0A8Y6D1_ARUDO
MGRRDAVPLEIPRQDQCVILGIRPFACAQVTVEVVLKVRQFCEDVSHTLHERFQECGLNNGSICDSTIN